MELEGSLPCSQQPSTGPYSEPDCSSPHLAILKIHSNIIFLSTPRSSKWSLPFKFSDQNFVLISHLFIACYMPRLSYSPGLDRPNSA